MRTWHGLATLSPPSKKLNGASVVSGTLRDLAWDLKFSGTCTGTPWKVLERGVYIVQHITRCELTSLQELYTQRCLKKSLRIIKDPTHPCKSLFSLLPSKRRCWSIKSTTSRQNIFISLGYTVRLLNKWHTHTHTWTPTQNMQTIHANNANNTCKIHPTINAIFDIEFEFAPDLPSSLLYIQPTPYCFYILLILLHSVYIFAPY